MKRATLVLLGILAATAFAFVACDDEPTQEEANEEFCDDVSELLASLRAIRDLDADSTFEEVEDARERARNAYEGMVESSRDVVDVRLDSVEEAYDELQRTVNAIDEDTTLGDALGAVDDDVENLATEVSLIFNDVDCTGIGSESPSDE
jgi:hypothetical protein